MSNAVIVITEAEQVVVDKYLNVVTESDNLLTDSEVVSVYVDDLTNKPSMTVVTDNKNLYVVYGELDTLVEAYEEYLCYTDNL